MSLQTGGRALGATSTRARADSWARRRAAPKATIPTRPPLGPTRRTSLTRILSLIRGSVLMGPPRDGDGSDRGHEKGFRTRARGSLEDRTWAAPTRHRPTRGRTVRTRTRRPDRSMRVGGGLHLHI